MELTLLTSKCVEKLRPALLYSGSGELNNESSANRGSRRQAGTGRPADSESAGELGSRQGGSLRRVSQRCDGAGRVLAGVAVSTRAGARGGGRDRRAGGGRDGVEKGPAGGGRLGRRGTGGG